MSATLRVVKVGGNELEDAAWVGRLADVLAGLRGRTVVVHGGGREVTALQRQLGAEPEWRDGLRVTTPQALQATRLVLSGLVNKRLVGALLDAGLEALGLSGEDGGLIRAALAQGGALGRVGEVAEVRAGVLLRLLGAGFTPVVSPVSRAADGDALNVNADDAAAAVAAALGADALLFVSNVPGVLADGAPVPVLGADEVERWVAGGAVDGGMVPKLRAAVRAARAGVADVRIGDLAMLGSPTAGTRLSRAERAVRTA